MRRSVVGEPLGIERVERVAEQIDDYLLDLHAIANHSRQELVQVELDANATAAGFETDHLSRFAEQTIQIELRHAHGLWPRELTQAANDVGSTIDLGRD